MAYIFQTRTDGLGHATLRGCQERWEEPPELPDDSTPDVDALTDEVIEVIGRACRARDPKAQSALLVSAANMLLSLAEEVAE